MSFMSSRSKQGREISYIYKKRGCITVTSHVNSSKSNNPNTYNSDNSMGNSNIPCSNVHMKRLSNELVTLRKGTDTESIISINE